MLKFLCLLPSLLIRQPALPCFPCLPACRQQEGDADAEALGGGQQDAAHHVHAGEDKRSAVDSCPSSLLGWGSVHCPVAALHCSMHSGTASPCCLRDHSSLCCCCSCCCYRMLCWVGAATGW